MGTRTTNRNFYKPDFSERGWDDEVNENFDTIDRLLAPEVVDLRDFPIDVTGNNESSSAILSAIAELPQVSGERSGILKFPAGILTVSAPLLVSIARGMIWQGAGKNSTFIRPTTALSGLSVIQWNDVRESSIRDMCIEGNASAPPDAAIESRRANGGAHIPTANEFRNLILGSEAVDNLVKGMKFTQTGGDENNDNHMLFDVAMSQTSGYALSIEHGQSQLHKIYNISVRNCGGGIKTAGGCYNLIGGSMTVREGGWDFEFASGTYYGHPTEIVNVNIEDGAWLLKTASSADIHIYMSHVEKSGGDASPPASGSTDIDFQSSNGTLTIDKCRLPVGVPVEASCTGASQVVQIHRTITALQEITFAGDLRMSGNTHLAGTLTLTPSGSGKAWVLGDSGGGFTKNQLRVYGDYLTLQGQSGTLIDSTGGDLQLRTQGLDRWAIQNQGHFICATDGGFNIGASGANRPDSVHVKTQTVSPLVVMAERSDPTGTSDQGKLYVRDNGAGKSQLCVIFGTGAVQVLATEP